MDRAAFLLERETLRARMESRRQDVTATMAERQSGFIPRLLKTGAGALFGLGIQGESLGWISSLFWAAFAPIVVGVAQRGGDALIHKVVQGIFPDRSSK